MKTIWVGTISLDGEVYTQVVSYTADDMVRFLLKNPDAHIAQWELPDPSGGADPELIGP